MTENLLAPTERRALKARAHPLDPVVIVGDAGLTPAVLKEIERALTAHELIKVRVANDDRDERNAFYETICAKLDAAPVQHIGKLLVLYRVNPDLHKIPVLLPTKAAGRKVAKTVLREEAKRNPVTGKLFVVKTSTRKVMSNDRPPRTERVRKSGQKSSKKAFQNN
jgi:putative YhbY family RNA-binding protein